MSKIWDMLKKEKVKWKRLGEEDICVSIATGLNPRKNFVLNDTSEGELTSWYITTKDYSTNEEIEFVEGKTARITEAARSLINKRSKLELNDILFSAVGTVGKIAFVNIDPSNFDVNESTFVLKPNRKNIIPKYLVYYLRSDFIQNEVKKSLKGSTLAGIRKNKLEDLQIPIPSLATQEKIVDILDRFTECTTNLCSELNKELELRIQQYEYYRDLMLSEEYLKKLSKKLGNKGDKLRFVNLGAVTDIILGGTPNKQRSDYWDNGIIPWINSGEVNKKIIYETDNFITQKGYDNSSATMVPENSTVIALAGQGKTRGLVARIKIKLCTNQSLATLVPKDDLINDYLYYYLESQYIKLRAVSSGDGSRGGLNKEILKNYPITLPSIQVQEYIVSILDKFHTIVHDLKIGLPKEIELRQKQYEYYRDKLLAFDSCDC